MQKWILYADDGKVLFETTSWRKSYDLWAMARILPGSKLVLERKIVDRIVVYKNEEEGDESRDAGPSERQLPGPV